MGIINNSVGNLLHSIKCTVNSTYTTVESMNAILEDLQQTIDNMALTQKGILKVIGTTTELPVDVGAPYNVFVSTVSFVVTNIVVRFQTLTSAGDSMGITINVDGSAATSEITHTSASEAVFNTTLTSPFIVIAGETLAVEITTETTTTTGNVLVDIIGYEI